MTRTATLQRALSVAVFLGAWAAQHVEGGKILVLHPMFAPSHVLALRALALNMTDRGHQVTVVRVLSSIPDYARGNITEHILHTDNRDGKIPFYTKEKQARFMMPDDTWENGHRFNFLPLEGLLSVASFCHTMLGNRELVQQLRAEQFDVVVVDLIYNECSLALAHHLGVPVVGYWAFTFVGYEPLYTAAHNSPSTVPYIFSQITDTKSFSNRVWNYFLHLYSRFLMELQFIVTSYPISHYLPGTPPSAALLANLSGLLINSHSAVDFPRLLPPTFKEVGGFHIRKPRSLPEHIESFISGPGPAGVVLFSLGCTFNTDTMPPAVVDNYMKAFARLPYKVLVKVTGEIKNVPSNVFVLNWLPQIDVLADPRTVVFVTHCGMHGIMEAIHFRVPMVGMPVFGDQYDMLLRLQTREVVVAVDKSAGEEPLYKAIMEAATNMTYRRNIAKLSQEVQHFNPDPLSSAVWVLEHVMLTQGAHHLKLKTQHLNWFTLLSLDVLTFFVAALATSVLLAIVIGKYLIRLSSITSHVVKRCLVKYVPLKFKLH